MLYHSYFMLIFPVVLFLTIFCRASLARNTGYNALLILFLGITTITFSSLILFLTSGGGVFSSKCNSLTCGNNLQSSPIAAGGVILLAFLIIFPLELGREFDALVLVSPRKTSLIRLISSNPV